ncbi:MAG TPA: helix-turn-helix transcriptional regulator [Pseudonocardiaceae bacterium]|nr:helix-turn-helix transcriptional regulator [Pseudonocardiaceae bacterium]
MRVALARRDISEVYRLLGAAGVSQRQIAALTGQNQSEISDIKQGRQVQAYDLLARIADGLRIPHGYMGLAYTDTTTQRLATSNSTITREDAWMERRNFLGLISKIVMGATLTATELDLIATTPRDTPVPRQVGNTEVTQLRVFTSALRNHDAAHGGGSCRDAILAHTQRAESLLTAACSEEVRPDLLCAVAEAKTLAGWTAHDLGLAKEARQYLTQALQTTQQADNPAHSAIVLYYLGRVPLDNGDPIEALKLFQLGQIAAQNSRSAIPVAFLLANEAVAYAHLGDSRQAMTALRRAEDEYTHATQEDQHPEFTRLFDHVALNTAAARVHSRLGLSDAKHREQGIARLNQALADDSDGRGRQRAFNHAWLATCALADGDPTSGAHLGNQALDATRGLTSPRLLKQLAPLQAQTHRYPHHGDVRQLAYDLQLLRTSG